MHVVKCGDALDSRTCAAYSVGMKDDRHPLIPWLGKDARPRWRIAADLGISESTLGRVLRGGYIDPRLALTIEARTGGDVTIKALIEWHARHPRSRPEAS